VFPLLLDAIPRACCALRWTCCALRWSSAFVSGASAGMIGSAGEVTKGDCTAAGATCCVPISYLLSYLLRLLRLRLRCCLLGFLWLLGFGEDAVELPDEPFPGMTVRLVVRVPYLLVNAEEENSVASANRLEPARAL